jgi:hypothetical protein
MNAKQIKRLSLTSALALGQFLGLAKVNATTVKIEQTGVVVKDVAGTTLSSNLAAKVGYWAANFTPTLDNVRDWDENFIAINGSYQATTKKYSTVFTMLDNQVVGGAQTAASLTGLTLPANSQLYLMGSNSAYNSSANTTASLFNSYIGPNSVGLENNPNSQVFILSDSSWVMRSGTATADINSYTLGFTGNTQLAVFGGTTFGKSLSYDSVTSQYTLQLIPEPTSLSLMSLGFGLLLLQNRLRVRRNKYV